MIESALPVGDCELVEGSGSPNRKALSACTLLVLLADLADRTSLTGQLSKIFAGRAAPQIVHDPGRVLVDVAVMLADGGECISGIAMLADQREVFGPVASDSTCWRVLDAISTEDLNGVVAARAAAREVAWAQRAEATGHALPASLVAGPNRHVLKLRRVTQRKVQMSDWCTVLPCDEVEPVPLMQPRQPENLANRLDLR